MSISRIGKSTISAFTLANTPDTMGGEVRASTPISGIAGVRVSIQRQSGGVVENFRRRGVRISHCIFSDKDLSALAQGNLITDDAGIDYTVSEPANDMGGQRRAWQVYVNQVA